jgi:hypothetical protein
MSHDESSPKTEVGIDSLKRVVTKTVYANSHLYT